MVVRVVKERVLRTLAEMRVGSNPTPCTSELSNDISEVILGYHELHTSLCDKYKQVKY